MSWGYARGVRKQAARQARAMVDLLGHHPERAAVVRARRAARRRHAGSHRCRFDRCRRGARKCSTARSPRALGRSDPTRPVVQNSGGGHDAHLWFGWRTATSPTWRRRCVYSRGSAGSSPRSARSRCPRRAAWMHPERWPELDWEELSTQHGMELDAFAEHVPPADAKSFDEWRDATQAYQAALLQLQIEDLRRCKGDPNGGFAVFAFADPSPAVGFGVLDHERLPKRAYAAVRDACRAGAADGRSAHRQRARRQRQPRSRSSAPRSTLPSTVACVDGKVTSTVDAVGVRRDASTSETQSTSRSS